ncbi:11L protein [Reticulomyxa filosa]|uniref:11L protein n=1 Tax=Reticulomyxa filosa TaxID=46433 RepID=X6LBD8_RETFI|nr:11L protein [Reticulomyxa filosa]|eukprot:ETN98695.1 11L protein [Reticulomyxa filosa]
MLFKISSYGSNPKKGWSTIVQKAIYISRANLLSLDPGSISYTLTAIDSGYPTIAISLFNEGAPFRARDLDLAIKKGVNEVVDYAIQIAKQGKFDVNNNSNKLYKQPFITVAISNNQENIAISLLKAGAKLSENDLSYALQKGWKNFPNNVVELASNNKGFKASILELLGNNVSDYNAFTKLFPELLNKVINKTQQQPNSFIEIALQFLTELFNKSTTYVEKYSNTVVHAYAASKVDNIKVKDLIQSMKMNVNSKNIFGDTPLHFGVCSDYYKVIKNIYIHKNTKNFLIKDKDNTKNPEEKYVSFFGDNESFYAGEYTYNDTQSSFKAKNGIIIYVKKHSSNFRFEVETSYSTLPVEKVEFLLQMGVDAKAKNSFGLSPRAVIANFCPDFMEEFEQMVSKFAIPVHGDL